MQLLHFVVTGGLLECTVLLPTSVLWLAVRVLLRLVMRLDLGLMTDVNITHHNASQSWVTETFLVSNWVRLLTRRFILGLTRTLMDIELKVTWILVQNCLAGRRLRVL